MSEERETQVEPGAGETIKDELSLDAIKRVLPHREPFLLIDRLLEHVPGERIVGVRSVNANDIVERDEFCPEPHMPYTLILESIAQTGAVLQLSKPENEGKNAFFAGIDKVHIGRPARAGEQLVMEASTVRQRGSIGWMSGVAKVDGEVVVEGVYMFALTGTMPVPD